MEREYPNIDVIKCAVHMYVYMYLLHEHLKVNDMEAFYDNDHFVPCTPPSVDGTTIHKINHSRRK
jgi:hypothetical protein